MCSLSGSRLGASGFKVQWLPSMTPVNAKPFTVLGSGEGHGRTFQKSTGHTPEAAHLSFGVYLRE